MPTAEPLAHSPETSHSRSCSRSRSFSHSNPQSHPHALALTLTPPLALLHTLVLTLHPEPGQVAPPFTEVLAGSGVEFVRGTVAGLDAESRMVRVTTGGDDGGGGAAAERLLPYDACANP